MKIVAGSSQAAAFGSVDTPELRAVRAADPTGRVGSRRSAAFALAAALGLAAFQVAAEPPQIPLTADQQQAFGIELAEPVAADRTLSRRFPGRVAVPNRQQQVIATPQAGVIEALLVAEGEEVTAGQVLARLRSPQLVEAQSAYLEALARLELAESELARDQMLHREGVIAERRLLESRARHQELAAMLQQRRELLELAGMSADDVESLRRSRHLSSTLAVRSGIGGIVLEQMVSTGQSLAAAEALYRVADLDPLWVEVHVPVDRLTGIEVGAPALLPAMGIEGRVVGIGRQVHGEDQGVLVRAEIDKGAERLRPGQFVEVQLTLAGAGDAGKTWRVPSAAVIRNAGDAYVFAARGDGFAVLPVRVLAEEERDTVVAGELRIDDRVAVSGTVALKAAWLAGTEPDAGAD
jgi:cobalt-zinc-cadmium efflux system membrane fusion protein